MTWGHFLPLLRNKAKISWKLTQPFCNEDIIGSQNLLNSNWGDGARSCWYTWMNHLESVSAVNLYSIKYLFKTKLNTWTSVWEVLPKITGTIIEKYLLKCSFCLVHVPFANMEEASLWPAVQQTTWGQSRHFGFTFGELSCRPSL